MIGFYKFFFQRMFAALIRKNHSRFLGGVPGYNDMLSHFRQKEHNGCRNINHIEGVFGP
jgi:hypothetical protein